MLDILSFVLVMSVIYLVLIFVYRRYLRRWNRLSDKDRPVARLPLLDGNEVMYVYSQDKGSVMSLVFSDKNNNSVSQKGILIPKHFKTPYDFIDSGELDSKIKLGLAQLESKQVEHTCVRNVQLSTAHKPEFDYDAQSWSSLNLY